MNVIEAPARKGRVDLRWLLKRMGKESVTSLLVEGGGEVNGSFLQSGLALAFFRELLHQGAFLLGVRSDLPMRRSDAVLEFARSCDSLLQLLLTANGA